MKEQTIAKMKATMQNNGVTVWDGSNSLASDYALYVSEGDDYDANCQDLTDAIADALGIPQDERDYDTNEEYVAVNEIANDLISEQLDVDDTDNDAIKAEFAESASKYAEQIRNGDNFSLCAEDLAREISAEHEISEDASIDLAVELLEHQMDA